MQVSHSAHTNGPKALSVGMMSIEGMSSVI